jgi:hypothetical protein
MITLLLALACNPTTTGGSGAAPGTLAVDATDSGAVGDDWSFTGQAYQACLADAECDPGSACTAVPGHATSYCAPACTPDPDAPEALSPACATDTAEGVCLPTGRCAQSCAESDTCADELACADVEDVGEVCAGEQGGAAGYYGTCTHPQLDGPDCPPSSSCYGGELLGIEDGICLPWCDDNICQPIPDGTEGVTPLCYDVGLDHPVCALLCQVGDSVCPAEQECMDLGPVGLCAPVGTTVPFEPELP